MCVCGKLVLGIVVCMIAERWITFRIDTQDIDIVDWLRRCESGLAFVLDWMCRWDASLLCPARGVTRLLCTLYDRLTTASCLQTRLPGTLCDKV